MNYGFIGAGNMAFSLMSGMIANGAAKPGEVFIYEKIKSRADEVCEKLGVAAVNGYEELFENCGAVFFVVKPNQMEDALKNSSGYIKKHNALVISVAAGKTIGFIESFIGANARVIRIMPNVNAQICKGMTAFFASGAATGDDKTAVVNCLKAIGGYIELEEKLFPVFTAVASCAPAYAYLFIDALAAAAVKFGVGKKAALEIAAQTVFGSAAMTLESAAHPRELIDKVCSPGGATIEGLCSLMADGFESAVVNAISAAYYKTTEL